MGLIKILDSDLKLQAILRDVLDCTRYEELNGENTVSFSCVLDEKAQYINDNAIVELDNDFFDVVYYQKKQNEDGTMTVDVEAEHVSYRLNNPEYNKDYFTSTGTPINVLTAILQGTGFTVGDVEFADAVTYSAQEAKSRRQILMEFLTLLGGEAVFNKFTVSILQHRGQTEPQIYTTGKNIKVISKIFDKRENDENGDPLVAYICEPLNLPNRSAGLGDEVLLIHNEIGVKETLRVVSVAYNPYDPLTCELQIANFVHGLEDQLYRIETNTVTKGKVYNGCRISADEGFVANRSDNKAKTVLNATEGISIYSDLGNGLVKNFFVDTNGRIKAKGIDIDGSGTFSGTIKANQLLIGGDNGSISFGDLSDQPFIPDASYITTITKDTVTTSYVNALNITAGSVAAENITGTSITGKNIFSGKFYGINEYTLYCKMDYQDGLEAFSIFRHGANNPIFSIKDEIDEVALYGGQGVYDNQPPERFLAAHGNSVRLFGSWDFSFANVSGISSIAKFG